jgi:SAM-dependent methyltransferase
MAAEDWARGADTDTPTAARIYDYMLGGSHHFAADRAAAQVLIDTVPDVRRMARANRAFLARAVRYLIDAGVRQFLDIGSGIPTVGNVHQIAQDAAPDTRVVYVDIDPIAVLHSRALLDGNQRATAILADLRQPDQLLALLEQPEQRAVLDLTQPVALLLASVLHFVPDDDQAYPAVQALTGALPAGSYLVISHAATEGWDEHATGAAQDVYRKTTTPGGPRARAQIERFFDGLELVEPGLVWVSTWRPEEHHDDPFIDQPQRSGMLAGVGRKPG